MSVRRSARVHALDQVSVAAIKSGLAPEEITRHSSTVTTKRLRKSKTNHATTDSQPQDNAVTADTAPATASPFKTPATPPTKRRKVQPITSLPPVTPTPSAIGFMTSKTPVSYSTGDIDDPTSPIAQAERPAEPHATNAPLQVAGDNNILAAYSNFEDVSPSRPSTIPPPAAATATATTATLLDQAIAHLLRVDPRLRTVIEKHHCKPFSPDGLAEVIDPFRSLSSGIMAQQVSGAAASSIKNKFIGLFPASATHAGPPHFPPPELVAATPLPVLRSAGLSQRKAEYIQGLAEKFVAGELSADMLAAGSDEEVMEELVKVRGLGKWSVEMFCCFGLKRMDVFSTGDLGVQRGMAALMGRDVGKLKAKGGGKWKYMSEKDMLEHSAKYAPYRSLFMWYMWRIEEVGVNVDAIQNA